VYHWSNAATVKFNELYTRYNSSWTYEKFLEVWPEQEFGKVDRIRFYNKNKTEKRKREAQRATGPVLPPPSALWPRAGDKRKSPMTSKGKEYAEERAKRRMTDNG
jgi:hypothetical protein